MPTGTINVQLPPLELKILFAILSCWAYRQWIYAETKGTGLNNYSWPIVFSSALSGLASHQGSQSCFGTCINLSNVGFKLRGPGSDTNAYYVVGIGK